VTARPDGLPRLPRLLLLTDRSQLRLGRGLVRTVAECAEAGLTHVVLRELDLAEEHRAALAQALAATGVTVVAARRPLPTATGLHLSATGAPPAGERPRLLGRSCHDPAEVAAAADGGLDYATLGPWAATPSKPGYPARLDPTAYAGLPLPTFALGGLTPDNAHEALAAGAHGVAVMGAVMRAADPAGVVADLLAVTGRHAR